ncbi:hypothetical protein [Paeniglutamicibacter kerguelensis]|uniref:ABC-type multidrug transport system fused ATPase/permease subunit n=1 Tax=Paeniglutamicibacter kerguelensis TaxID=254788 RepID=A0ABS4XCS6_9MICC|nr:hypothetical protein [Paeniglutamicibacter kerguelensis]MBP2386033.1 ABC-type multidrug transport system fused ATPase/permease subunit [Paeniglutamicibacter kerguelensis]
MRQNPLLRIRDEPTAALNPKPEDELYRRFVDQATGFDGMVTVPGFHRFLAVRTKDEILVVSGGKIVERGNPEQLMSNKSEYARIYVAQAGGYN